MQLEIAYTLTPQQLEEVATIHFEALSYRSFITNFGKAFLVEVYKTILLKNIGFFVIASENGQIKAFILACKDSNQLMSSILKRGFSFFPIVFKQIFKQPKLIFKTLETLLYSKKEQTAIRAELVVIATIPTLRSQGIGQQLIQVLEKEFLRCNILNYKVTVHKVMEKSNNFYVKNNFSLLHTFKMYNVEWNLYAKQL